MCLTRKELYARGCVGRGRQTGLKDALDRHFVAERACRRPEADRLGGQPGGAEGARLASVVAQHRQA